MAAYAPSATASASEAAAASQGARVFVRTIEASGPNLASGATLASRAIVVSAALAVSRAIAASGAIVLCAAVEGDAPTAASTRARRAGDGSLCGTACTSAPATDDSVLTSAAHH